MLRASLHLTLQLDVFVGREFDRLHYSVRWNPALDFPRGLTSFFVEVFECFPLVCGLCVTVGGRSYPLRLPRVFGSWGCRRWAAGWRLSLVASIFYLRCGLFRLFVPCSG